MRPVPVQPSLFCKGSLRSSSSCLLAEAPSLVSLSLRFAEIMAEKSAKGDHPPSWNTEKRLQSVLDEFHASKHMTSKFALDAEKTRSILNLITGTVPAPWQQPGCNGSLPSNWLKNACRGIFGHPSGPFESFQVEGVCFHHPPRLLHSLAPARHPQDREPRPQGHADGDA